MILSYRKYIYITEKPYKSYRKHYIKRENHIKIVPLWDFCNINTFDNTFFGYYDNKEKSTKRNK